MNLKSIKDQLFLLLLDMATNNNKIHIHTDVGR